MLRNINELWHKTSYNKKNNLWYKDSFIRKDKETSKSTYLIKEVYSHGLSTYLFDRNTGIYAYQKKGIETAKLSGKRIAENNQDFNSRNKSIKSLPQKWKLSIKKLRLFNS